MIWFRKGLVLLLSGLLLISLVGGVIALDANRDLANPRALEGWLAKSKIYDHILASTLNQAKQSDSSGDDAGSVSLGDPQVQQIAAEIFTPDLIQGSVSAYLEGNYSWLTGKKAAPDYRIDLTSAKQKFAQSIGKATYIHLAGLPVCTPAQLAQLPIPVDPLTIECRPGTLDPKAEGDRVALEINDSDVIIADPVITPDSVSQGQPYYKRLSWLPTFYQIILKLPWILGGLALLSALGIAFISVTRRRGVRRIGWVLLLSGLALIGLKMQADIMVQRFDKLSVSNALGGEFKQSLSEFAHQFEPHVVRHYLWFGGAFLLIAFTIFIVLIATRQKAAKSDTGTPEPEEQQPEPPIDDTPSAPSSPSTPITDLTDSRPKPTAPKPPPPLGKNPPRPKRPRLIQ